MNSIAPQAQAPLRTVKVIVAEDEVLVRLMVADVLRGAGFQVFEAANVDEAIIILESAADVDVVIADMHMRTVHDGMNLANYVRARHPGVAVLLASAHTPATLVPFDAFFLKPYRPEDMVTWIKRRLGSNGNPSPAVGRLP